MKVLGIDPGTATTGYGLIEVDKNGECKALKYDLIETDKTLKPQKRLEIIYGEMLYLLKTHKPDVMSIEKIFFATNAKTAIRVGQALGVMLLAASKTKTDVFEYAPGTIKKMVAGNGRADKKDVQKAIRKILGNGVRSKPKKKTHFDNAADGLAVAICHIRKMNGGGDDK